MNTFTAEEFADYWESYNEDTELGINFMASKVVDEDGRKLLSETATTLAQRHGVSSSQLKTFRSGLRKACKKAGTEDIWTPKKVAGTGTKSHPAPMVTISISKRQKNPKVVDHTTLCINRMRKWIEKEGISIDDIQDAVDNIRYRYSDVVSKF